MKVTDYRAAQAASVNEAWLTERVRDLCTTLGLARYHTLRPKGSPAGYPDETIVGKWVMFRELKRQTGVVSAEQKEWIRRLLAAGADVAVWRPEDWFSGRITTELTALAKGAQRLPAEAGRTNNQRGTARLSDRVKVRPGSPDIPEKARAVASANNPAAPAGGAP